MVVLLVPAKLPGLLLLTGPPKTLGWAVGVLAKPALPKMLPLVVDGVLNKPPLEFSGVVLPNTGVLYEVVLPNAVLDFCGGVLPNALVLCGLVLPNAPLDFCGVRFSDTAELGGAILPNLVVLCGAVLLSTPVV